MKKAVYLFTIHAEKKRNPVLVRLTYLREHTETYRFECKGPAPDRELGSLYVPKRVFDEDVPGAIDVALFWK